MSDRPGPREVARWQEERPPAERLISGDLLVGGSPAIRLNTKRLRLLKARMPP